MDNEEQKRPIKPGTDQAAVVDYVVGNFEDWKERRSVKEKNWTDCLNNYLTFVDESKYENWPWRSKCSDTFSQEIGDVVSAAVKNALFPFNEDFFKLEGLDDQSKDNELKMYKYMLEKLDNARYVERNRPFLKQLAVYGNSAAILPWVHKKRPRKVRDPRSRQVKWVDEVLYDNFTFTTQDMFDVVMNPGKMYDPLSSPVIYRSITTLAELGLTKKDNVYQNLEQLEKTADGTIPTDKSDAQKTARAQIFGLSGGAEDGDEEIELLVCLGDMIIDGEMFFEHIAVIANRKVLLRFEEIPFWGGKPLVFTTYDDYWFAPYGRGPLEPVLGIHELINTFVNQKADVLNLIIMGSYAYVNDGVIDPDSLFQRPGGAIEVGDINNLKALHPNTNVALAYQEIEQLRGRGERSTAVSDYEVGVFPGGRKTAYETSVIKQGSSNRFNDTIKHIGESSVEYSLRHFLTSLQQFKYGSGEIDDEVLLGRYKVNYFGADMSALRQMEQQQLSQISDVVGRNPVFADAIEPVELLKEWFKAIGIRNEKILKSQQKFEIEQARKQVLEAAQAAGPQQQRGEVPQTEEQTPQPLIGAQLP
jgi:co-chaperonin GroES (HSP10)